MKKSILVVGGAGYIGSHIVHEFLKAGYAVSVFDNMSSGQQINLFEEATFIHGDIQDRILLKDVFSQHFDAVVHLAGLKAAGESMIIPEAYAYQNINGTLNLLEAISHSSTRTVVFSSSAAVYGMPQYLPIDEEHPISPINFYGFTKREIERFLEWYDQIKEIKFASLRYFNAAGYHPEGKVKGLENNPANLIPIVMEVAAGKRKTMDVFGDDYPTKDGTGVRDYIHVSDLASAHLKVFEHIKKTHQSITLNLGTGVGYSVLEIINMTEKVTQKKVNYQIVPRRAGDPAELYAKSEMAESCMGWKPQYSDLETLIRSTWEVYRNQ